MRFDLIDNDTVSESNLNRQIIATRKTLGKPKVEVFSERIKNGTAAKIFTALAKVRVNVRIINQEASELNVIVGVLNEDFERAIRSIYGAFVEEDPPD